MCRMRFETNTVQYEHIKTLHQFDRFVRDKIEIRRVSKIVETICHYRQLAVNDLKRRDLKFVADGKRRVMRYRMWYQLRKTAAKMVRLENVFENAAKIYPRGLVCI